MVKDQYDFTMLAEWRNGKWKPVEDRDALLWTCVGATQVRRPDPAAILLGYWGEILSISTRGRAEEQIAAIPDGPANRGPMRSVAEIDGLAYAVGMGRQAYRREAPNRWTCIDQTARPPAGDASPVSFEAIHGFTDREIYAAGLGGEVWSYGPAMRGDRSALRWDQVDSPTNFPLISVCCAGDGLTYISGRAGTLLRGRGDQWSMLDQDETDEDLWSMAYFQGKLYLSSTRAVYTLHGNTLSTVRFGDDTPGTCFNLRIIGDVLWSIGPKDIMEFDGRLWRRIN
jgi:hypothetical protein